MTNALVFLFFLLQSTFLVDVAGKQDKFFFTLRMPDGASMKGGFDELESAVRDITEVPLMKRRMKEGMARILEQSDEQRLSEEAVRDLYWQLYERAFKEVGMELKTYNRPMEIPLIHF